MTWGSLFRLAAILLLLFTGVELFACEVIAPGRCESFGYPSDGQQTQGLDDNCICCCAHVLMVDLTPIAGDSDAVCALEFKNPPKSEREPASIYHPPKV